MSAINDRPLDYDFGLEFDYSVWTEETEVEFLNVPWDAAYRDVVRFPNRAALNSYVDNRVGLTLTIEQMSYIKPGTPIMVDRRHNEVNRFNYVRVRNPLQPGSSDIQKDFYYFVTGVEYIAQDTTAVYVQLDVWQTFIYDVVWGNCYIERGHIGIANTKQFDAFGRDYLTVPEGLDTGAEMRVISTRKAQIMGRIQSPNPEIRMGIENYCVMVVSTQDLTANPFKPDGSTPQIVTAPGSRMDLLGAGAGLYAFETPDDFVSWMASIQQTSWRAQGIKAAYIIPDLKRYDPNWEWPSTPVTPKSMDTFIGWPNKHTFFPNWRESAEILNRLPERYRHLRKFFTFPYMAIEMTTWTATPIILKPESWATPNADVLERASLFPPSQRVDLIPRRYNGDPNAPIENWLDYPDETVPAYQQDIGDDGGEWLDFATRIQNFPSIPIVSDSGVAYLASNQHSIQQSYNAADWSQQRALTGNTLSYDQSSQNSRTLGDSSQVSRNLMDTMNNLGNQNLINQTNISTATGVAQGLVGQAEGGFNPLALLGNGIGAIGNNASALAQTMHNTDVTSAQMSSANRQEQITQDNMKYMRDTNLEYADFAAKGDYAQTIAALNAKVRDAAMMQPAMSGQFGGEFANLANNSVDVSLRWKLIDNAAIAAVGEIWLQFGYAVHRSVSQLPQDLMVMTKFTYWKLQKTYLRAANMPETYRQTLRGVMESGVTVWGDPDDIGFTDFADNQPLEGITL